MSDAANPYAPPAAGVEEFANETYESTLLVLGGLMVRWEALRIAYNAALVATTLATAVLVQKNLLTWPMIEVLVTGVFSANLLYSAGHLADGYLHWLGLRTPWTTFTFFSTGTALACCLASISVINEGQLDGPINLVHMLGL